MAEAHSTPKTLEHLISIGKIIITNANIFSDAVEKWDSKPEISQTWTNFKARFIEVQSNYNNSLPSNTAASHLYTIKYNIL